MPRSPASIPARLMSGIPQGLDRWRRTARRLHEPHFRIGCRAGAIRPPREEHAVHPLAIGAQDLNDIAAAVGVVVVEIGIAVVEVQFDRAAGEPAPIKCQAALRVQF